MKKIAIGALSLLSMLALASCNNNSNNENSGGTVNPDGTVDYEFETPEINGEVTPVTKPTIDPVDPVTPVDPVDPTPTESTVKIERANFKTMLRKDVDDEKKACPSVGNPKVLVIPVNLDSSKATNANITKIKTAFNGDETSTGWESLKSYYKKSSNNKLDFDITVLEEWFTPAKSKTYYDDYRVDEIVDEALKYYDSKIDFSKYDTDSDGVIDGVHIVYNCTTDYTASDTVYWAFTADYEIDAKYDGVEVGKYVFSGVDFFDEEDNEYYETADILVDAHTIIHETGHMLGLQDYYDYDSSRGASAGLYGPSMMDVNNGDLSPLDKMFLGWVEPLVITGKGAFNYSLAKFETTNDFIILADHTLTSIYDEFFIIEYYTEDGLNAHDKPIDRADKNTPCKGIRLYHVNATLNLDSNGNQVPNSLTYFESVFKYDNSWTTKSFFKVITRTTIKADDYLSENELFKVDGKSFGVDYAKNYKLDNGKSLFFTFTVNSLGDKANLTFNLL